MRSDPLALDDLIVISRDGTRIADDQARLSAARAQFEQTGVLVLRGFLAAPLLAWVQQRVEGSPFNQKVHPASGLEDCMVNNDVIWMLRFLLGTSDVLRAVEGMTGAGPLNKTQLRVYRFVPDSGHHHDWHDDLGEGRRLGLSVNVSTAEFEGGNLQLRETDTGRMLCDVRNTGAGDAAIFHLARGVQHQVLPVTGVHPRLALAGWFRE